MPSARETPSTDTRFTPEAAAHLRAEIKAAGGNAIANYDSVADYANAGRM